MNVSSPSVISSAPTSTLDWGRGLYSKFQDRSSSICAEHISEEKDRVRIEVLASPNASSNYGNKNAIWNNFKEAFTEKAYDLVAEELTSRLLSQYSDNREVYKSEEEYLSSVSLSSILGKSSISSLQPPTSPTPTSSPVPSSSSSPKLTNFAQTPPSIAPPSCSLSKTSIVSDIKRFEWRNSAIPCQSHRQKLLAGGHVLLPSGVRPPSDLLKDEPNLINERGICLELLQKREGIEEVLFSYPLKFCTMLIGRACQIPQFASVLEKAKIFSREHTALMVNNQGKILVTDLKSLCGTHVFDTNLSSKDGEDFKNRKKLRQLMNSEYQELQIGDSFALCDNPVLIFRINEFLPSSSSSTSLMNASPFIEATPLSDKDHHRDTSKRKPSSDSHRHELSLRRRPSPDKRPKQDQQQHHRSYHENQRHRGRRHDEERRWDNHSDSRHHHSRQSREEWRDRDKRSWR